MARLLLIPHPAISRYLPVPETFRLFPNRLLVLLFLVLFCIVSQRPRVSPSLLLCFALDVSLPQLSSSATDFSVALNTTLALL